MKIKSDFVTNSSSTSFIISSKEKLKEMKYVIEVDLLRDLRPTLLDKKSINHHIWEDDNDYKEIKKAIDDGEFLYHFHIANDGDNPMELYFLDNGFKLTKVKNNKDLKVVREMAGI